MQEPLNDLALGYTKNQVCFGKEWMREVFFGGALLLNLDLLKRLYYVDSEGNRVCGDLFAVGSGSMYAYGVIDSGLRQDLTVEEACELGRRAIYQATYRDAYSGGQVNLYHVHSEGWTRVSQEDVLMLHQQYKNQA
ncbi:Proteasome subunit beta type-5 [Dissostichus eleginoides]|nr:Proteasome subunit beta type-5 [Dissostichus eleginoides]